MSLQNSTPLTYASYIQAIATLAVIPLSTDANGYLTTASEEFNQLVPQMVNYAEQRMQRDLDLLASQTNSTSYALTAGSDQLAVAVNDFFNVQSIGFVSGAKTTQLTPVAKEFIQAVYNDSSYAAPPEFFAPFGGDVATLGGTSTVFLIGPRPDQSYPVQIVGMGRAPSLAQFAGTPQAATGTTWLATWLPDLLIMASMVFISGYQRNFAASGNDPQAPINYESQYQTLLKGATVEEARRRFIASGWTSLSPTPVATADRK